MSSAVCTLFEGHHHYGVASLTNSLYNQGFRGIVYAGYHGELPFWAGAAKQNSDIDWVNASVLEVVEGLAIYFLPLDTPYHLSNYKPNFMLKLWSSLASKAEGMFYFDPDIILTATWASLEDWIGCGVALCEDVNSPLAMYHPMRSAWRRYFEPKGFTLRFKEAIYANSGFIGISRLDRGIIETWKLVQEAMAPAIGGLNRSAFTKNANEIPPFPFYNSDQDALNAAIEAWDGKVSFVDKTAMAFVTGAPIMPHAIGRDKPWLWNPLLQALRGLKPRAVDRDYWDAASGPIKAQTPAKIWRRKLGIQVAGLICRFYSRK
jgi:hypothetical protein